MCLAFSRSMRALEASRWDDIVLAALLLVIGVPRMLLAFLYDHPIGAEGALAMVSVGLALFILIRRNWSRPSVKVDPDAEPR
jgi:hypothetical protein